jgi:hypothetical protein
MPASEQHVPGGAEGDLQRRRVLVRERLGHPHQLLRGSHDVFREAARPTDTDEVLGEPEQVGHDPVTDAPLLLANAVTDALDRADQFQAEDVRQRDLETGDAFADVDVDVVQRAGADPDSNVSGAQLWVGDIVDAQLVSAAKLVYANSLHGLPPSLGATPERVRTPGAGASRVLCLAPTVSTLAAVPPGRAVDSHRGLP